MFLRIFRYGASRMSNSDGLCARLALWWCLRFFTSKVVGTSERAKPALCFSRKWTFSSSWRCMFNSRQVAQPATKASSKKHSYSQFLQWLWDYSLFQAKQWRNNSSDVNRIPSEAYVEPEKVAPQKGRTSARHASWASTSSWVITAKSQQPPSLAFDIWWEKNTRSSLQNQ